LKIKQKTRFKILEILVIGISYRSMNGQYISISINPKKAILVDL